MISRKNIVILLCTLVVLVGALLAITFLWNDEPPSQDETNTQSIEVFTIAKDNIAEMDLHINGEKFAFAKKEDKWVLKGAEDVELNQSTVDYLCIDMAGIYAKEIIDENPADISAYGLDEPFGTYTLTFTDGDTKTFYLGDKNPITGEYYFKKEDTSVVYSLYENKGDSISKPSSQYKNSYILNIDGENLSRIYMQNKNTVMELRKSTKGQGENVQVEWRMTQPINNLCDIQPISENIISKISYITVSEFIDEADERYAKSGVSNPEATLTLTDDDNVSQTIYIGKAQGDSRFIKTNNRVYMIPADSVSFIDIDPFIYVSKFINLQNIDEVESIEITHEGKIHIAVIEGEPESYVFKLDGKEVMEDTFKREVYQPIIGLMADGFAQTPQKGKVSYTVVYHKRDGSVLKNEYCEYDDRNYIAYDEKGNSRFIIRKKKLDEMFTTVEKVVNGK